MRRIILTLGALSLLGGCYVHDRAPARYGYAPAYGPRRDWRAGERREDHERREHEEREHRW